MQTIKTIIADDHAIFLEGLKSVLQRCSNPTIEIVGEASNGDELLQLLKTHSAQLLIFDLNMPGKDGLEVLKCLRNLPFEIATLALTMYDAPRIVRSAFKMGVKGYVLKDKGIEELFFAIREVTAGNNYMGSGLSTGSGLPGKAIVGGRSGKYITNDRFVKKHSLTKREIEILHLITQALSNKEIAKELFISDQTVSVHRKNIMRKLGVSNTAGLLKMAYDNSLV